MLILDQVTGPVGVLGNHFFATLLRQFLQRHGVGRGEIILLGDIANLEQPAHLHQLSA